VQSLLEWERETGSILSKEAAMKHHLSLFCFALLSFFYMDEAAAILLLKQNPTPLEPASYFVSGEGYQIAKVTWLPDYLGNNKSHGGGRVDNGGKGVDGMTCEDFDFLSSCPEHKKGTVKHPIAGLTCYEKCVCDMSYYKYSSSNCASPKVLGGEHCVNDLTALKPTVSMKTAVDLSSAPIYSLADGTLPQKAQALGNYTTCTCPEEYNLSVCPANANCKQCDSKYKFVDCKEGFTASGNRCVSLCPGYTLMVCPTGGTCSECPADNTKLTLDSCDETKGWTKSRNRCVAKDCPAGYTADVERCESSSTKPNYHQNGWSGGKQCGVCKCDNIDSTCTAANYPLTSQSVANATYESCTTGCGSEKVTRYRITGCQYSYKLNAAGTGCIEQTCQELNSKYWTGPIPTNSACSTDTYYGDKTCLYNCHCKYGYFPISSNKCQECAKGTYSGVNNLPIDKLLSGCTPCPTGKYQDKTGQSRCKSCSAGQYQDKTGQTSCKLCSAGRYQDQTGQASCKPCPVNTYSSGTGATSCTPCPAGTSTNGKTGQASCQAITVTCEAGNYYKNGTCQPCPTGTYKASAGNATSCTPCPVNTYSETGATVCTPGNIKLGVEAPFNNTKLAFILEGSSYTIDWGDGTTDANSSHTYAQYGDYIVTMTGDITSLYASPSDVKITKLHDLKMGTLKKAQFYSNCSELTGSIPNLPPNLISGFDMFTRCEGLTGEIPDLPASLENGASMFDNCIGLTGRIPTLPSSLTNAWDMFYNCKGLTGTAPSRPASLSECTNIFSGTKVTKTSEWSGC